MRITVLSGSPKEHMSVTLQYVKYIKKCFPMHDFDVINVGREIRKIEKNRVYFQSIIERIEQSDAIIWCFPVYYFLVPYQLKRFIELVLENGISEAFNGKHATAVTTSGHMLDNTAHNYIHAISEDLHMEYFEGYSAGIQDMTVRRERENLANFARFFFQMVQESRPTEKKCEPIQYNIPEFVPGEIISTKNTSSKRVAVFHEADGDVNLTRMIDVFTRSIDAEVDVVNINTVDIRSGCLGCMRCTYNGVCVQKDDVMAVVKEHLLPADAVIFAGNIRDRYLSSTWKRFIDRLLFMGHGPFLSGKQIGFLVSGPLRQIPNLRQVLEGLADVSGANLVGVVTDEYEDSGLVTTLLESLAKQAELSIDSGFKKPATFLGVGVHKTARDMVYENKAFLRADHIFYKKHGLLDFSQKKVSYRLMNLVLRPLLKITPVRKRLYRDLGKLMIRPYQRILEKA